MADYSQVELILQTVLTSPAFTNGCGPFERSLRVTTSIADIKVSEKQVMVHPEWAVELGPLEAASRIRQAATLFDQRRAEARAEAEAQLRHDLWLLVERIRKLGAEHLIDEVYHSPVARRRSLVKEDT
jgi:hypothetical protein